ncbi:TolC family protein [Cylindrospermopsis raciborskii CHAB3438]|uniref:TolC family protein n=1 Tax=Cylindrospermopsis TaxID=77021 RepID=UPI00070F8580|nr:MULTISPECIES: TolC family protein [Cylindrospermopsis]KRH98177.1 transporter [Cylindrospermopsis sp. CR12]MBU6344031.1 TolC family protein [Cyanobacteria bacterium REEB494]MCH4903252.1 TolC family protein [Cylindrospermopsis raciborskii CHAB3438]MEB3145391.1 TolC family protein [Cylindrospermopsis raciborskii]
MKGQQLFHSFLPGVTAAVLTTQPAWAGTFKANDLKLVSSPVVSTATNPKVSVVENNWQLAATTVDHAPLFDYQLDFGQAVLPELPSSSPLPVVNGANVPSPTKLKTVLSLSPVNPKVISGKTYNQVAQITLPQDNPSGIAQTNSQSVNPTSDSPQTILERFKPNPNFLDVPQDSQGVKVQTTEAISLEQALELAKQNNNDLQVAVLQLQRSQSSLREAQAALLPSLNVLGGVTRSRSSSATLQERQTAKRLNIPSENPDATSVFDSQAELRYDLYTSGRRTAAIKEAEEQVRLQQFEVERQSEEIRLNVATEYYGLQQSDESVRIARSAVENSQASLRDAQALERAGVGTKFDVLRSQVNLANSQQELTDALSQQAIARRRLSLRLNLPQSVSITASDPVQLAGLWKSSLEDSIVLAYENRAELQQKLAERNIREQQRKQALATLGPQISFIARYDLLDQFNDGVAINDGYSVGLRASMNLYDGGASRARAARAKTEIAIAETEFAERRNQVRFQVEEAYSSHLANLENVQTAATALDQAKESLRLARLRFQAGVGTQTDVINAQSELTRSEANRVRAILNYNLALTRLQRYVTSRAVQKS